MLSHLWCGAQAADQELAAARQQHQQAETRETALAVDLRALSAELSSTKVMLVLHSPVPHLLAADAGGVWLLHSRLDMLKPSVEEGVVPAGMAFLH